MIGLAALLLAVAQPQAPPEAPRGQHYACNQVLPNFDGARSSLTVYKSFRAADPSFMVYVENTSIVRPEPGYRPDIKLRWGEARPFDWADGSIEIDSFGQVIDDVVRPDDVARRVVVDRSNRLRPLLNTQHATQEIYLSPFDQSLVSQLFHPTHPPTLRMSLDTLLAWGSGQSSLTVYETMISRPEGRNPIGRERVMRRYEIDLVALARLMAQVRAATERWEAGLTRDRSSCWLEPNESLMTLPIN